MIVGAPKWALSENGNVNLTSIKTAIPFFRPIVFVVFNASILNWANLHKFKKIY